jgi:hypothetical protein
MPPVSSLSELSGRRFPSAARIDIGHCARDPAALSGELAPPAATCRKSGSRESLSRRPSTKDDRGFHAGGRADRDPGARGLEIGGWSASRRVGISHMAPKYHPTPLSGGDRKALSKELAKARAMTGILAERSQEKRRAGEALIREADTVADIRARCRPSGHV